MQNKLLKQRENRGWKQLHAQLDIDLPREKKKDRKVLWLFLLAGLGLSGIVWLSLNNPIQPAVREEKKLEIEPIQDKTGIQHPTASIPLSEYQTSITLVVPEPISDQTQIKASRFSTATGLNDKQISSPPRRTSGVRNLAGKTGIIDKADRQDRPTTVDDLSNLPMTKDVTAASSLPVDENKIISPVTEPLDNSKLLKEEKRVDQPNPVIVPITEDAFLVETRLNESLINTTDAPVESTLSAGQESEILGAPIAMPPIPLKSRRHRINLGMDYSSDQFFSTYLMAGKNWPAGKKLYFSGQAGLGFQFNKSNFKVIGSNIQSASGSGKDNNDINNRSVFSSVQADKILLDQSSVISGFRGDTLVLSANDQVDYQSRNQWMAAVQAGIGYRINPYWSVESGLHFKSYITASQELLRVNYAMATSNGFNSSSNSSIYQLKASTLRSQWSWYIQTGVSLTQRWGLNLQFITSPFIIDSGKAELANAVTGAGQASTTGRSLSLPIKQDASSLRFSIQYKF